MEPENSCPRPQAVQKPHLYRRDFDDVCAGCNALWLDRDAAAVYAGADGLYGRISRNGAVAGRFRSDWAAAAGRCAVEQGPGTMAGRGRLFDFGAGAIPHLPIEP